MMRKILALVLCLVLAFALAGCKSQAVKAAEALIDAIGEVTAESGDAVEAAEAALQALEEKERTQVENVQKLTDARNALDVALTEKLIDAIGEVTAESEEAVTAAEDAFSALTDAQRGAVSNADALTAAREKLDEALEEARTEALRQQLSGIWLCKVEMGQQITDLLEQSFSQQYNDYGVRFSGYLDSYILGMRLTLAEDGTYILESDEEVMKTENEKLGESVVNYMSDLAIVIIGQELLNQGTVEKAPETWEAITEMSGVGEDEFFQQSFGMSRKELVSYYGDIMGSSMTSEDAKENGTWQPEEGRLMMDESGGNDFSEDSAIDYTLEDGVMTWTGGTMPLADPLEYPVAFERIG